MIPFNSPPKTLIAPVPCLIFAGNINLKGLIICTLSEKNDIILKNW